MLSSTQFYEVAGNMHMHTPYSDGEGSHAHIAESAIRAGLEYVIVTDHNVLIQGVEGYYGSDDSGYTLLLTGEEIHDQQRSPQTNHMLVYGTDCELAAFAPDPQRLINAVNDANGLCFLAHPDDRPLHMVREPGIPWETWEVNNFTGLEIWNFMSSVKDLINQGKRSTVMAIFQPETMMRGPNPETLARWDALTSAGRRIVGIGNADAHGTTYRVGLLEHKLYPYDFLFACVNTHLLLNEPMSGAFFRDRKLIYRALRAGRAFIGYDLIGSTRGFRFSAHGSSGAASMGDSLKLGAGVTLQAIAPERSSIRLLRNGKVIASADNRENLTVTAHFGGAYRVEVSKSYRGQDRTWILSNPIYIEDSTYTVRK